MTVSSWTTTDSRWNRYRCISPVRKIHYRRTHINQSRLPLLLTWKALKRIWTPRYLIRIGAHRQELNSIWEQRLSQVTVQTNNRNDKEKFYGALYRASFLPRTFNNVDGRYPSFSTGHPFRQSANGRNYYEDLQYVGYLPCSPSFSQYPNPKESRRHDAIIGGRYEQGGWLPIFPCWNSYTAAMIGDHCISALGDAYISKESVILISTKLAKEYSGTHQDSATYEEYKKRKWDGVLLNSYLKYGYIPLEDSVPEAFHTCEQVSRTLEYAYDDFVLAQVLQKLETW